MTDSHRQSASDLLVVVVLYTVHRPAPRPPSQSLWPSALDLCVMLDTWSPLWCTAVRTACAFMLSRLLGRIEALIGLLHTLAHSAHLVFASFSKFLLPRGSSAFMPESFQGNATVPRDLTYPCSKLGVRPSFFLPPARVPFRYGVFFLQQDDCHQGGTRPPARHALILVVSQRLGDAASQRGEIRMPSHQRRPAWSNTIEDGRKHNESVSTQDWTSDSCDAGRGSWRCMAGKRRMLECGPPVLRQRIHWHEVTSTCYGRGVDCHVGRQVTFAHRTQQGETQHQRKTRSDP